MSGFEANFDGLVGPTHHYAGLSVGNEASQNNRDGLSNPKKAALQGLYKMKALADRGFVQGRAFCRRSRGRICVCCVKWVSGQR